MDNSYILHLASAFPYSTLGFPYRKLCFHTIQLPALHYIRCVLTLYSVRLNSINSVREPCLFGSGAELTVYEVLLFIYLINNSFQIVFQVLEETGLFSFFSYKVVR